jgi:hypothetical protein
MASVTKTPTKKSSKKEKTNFGKDKRRKHHHFLVTVYYADGEKFGRVYTDKDKADRFADRQKRSPVVKSARVTLVSWAHGEHWITGEKQVTQGLWRLGGRVIKRTAVERP